MPEKGLSKKDADCLLSLLIDQVSQISLFVYGAFIIFFIYFNHIVVLTMTIVAIFSILLPASFALIFIRFIRYNDFVCVDSHLAYHSTYNTYVLLTSV